MIRTPLAAVLALTVAACAQAPVAGEPTATLFKSLGGRQCEGGGQSADAAVAPLRAAGIEPLALHCGHDGRMRPQMCGAADGRIVIVEIPVSLRARAQDLGFAPLALRPDATREPCR